MHKEYQGFIFALVAVCFSAGMALFVKLSYSVPIPTIVFARFALGVPIFLYLARKSKIQLTWKNVPKNLIRSLAGIGNLYAFYFALKFLPLVNAITLSNTAPLFLPFLAIYWLKLKISKRRIIAIILGFIGVVIVLRPSASDFVILGSLLGLFSGLCRAVALLNVRMLVKTESIETILCYYFFIGSVLSFIPMVVSWESVMIPSQWIYVCLSGVFALGFQYMFTRACEYVESTKVSSINYLSVIFGALLGWLVFQEIPSLWFWLGASFIAVGAMIALLDPAAKRETLKK